FAKCNADETNLILTVDGVTYSNVTFSASTPLSVSIRHSTGITRVPLAKLPAELQKRLGYDPQKAASWLLEQKTQQQEQERLKVERAWEEALSKKQQPRFREINGVVYDFSAVIEWASHEQDSVSAQQTSQIWSEYNARANPQGLATPGGG